MGESDLTEEEADVVEDARDDCEEEDADEEDDDHDDGECLTTMPSSENSLLTAGLDFCSCAKLEVSATPRKSLSPPFNRCAESLLNNIWWSFSSTCGLGNDVSSSKDCAYQFLTLMVDGISRRPIGEFSRSFTFNARRIGSSSTMKREAKKMEPGDGDGPN